MADCNKQFKEFDKEIFLHKSKREGLFTSIKSIREKIIKDFKSEGGGYKPRFQTQGSYEMDTIINPLISGDYDIDEGVYFDVENEPDELPATFHRWIYDSVKNHTDKPPEDKNPCVRVLFADGHHIDLTIYYKQKYENHPKLAHKTNGWIESDPIEFIDWFEGKMDEGNQLRRIVRYLKAWADFRSGINPSGLILTILAAQNYVQNERDDLAFLSTVTKIKNWLDISFTCLRPTTPLYEDLLKDFSYTNKENFKIALESLVALGNQAKDETSLKNACLKWQKIFGDRFSCLTAEVSERAQKMADDLRSGKLGITTEGKIISSAIGIVSNVKPTKFYGEDKK